MNIELTDREKLALEYVIENALEEFSERDDKWEVAYALDEIYKRLNGCYYELGPEAENPYTNPHTNPHMRGHYYTIAYYDSFDNEWVRDAGAGHFDDLEGAKQKCLDLMKLLEVGNKKCGEHYSVFEWTDEKIKEVFRPSLLE